MLIIRRVSLRSNYVMYGPDERRSNLGTHPISAYFPVTVSPQNHEVTFGTPKNKTLKKTFIGQHDTGFGLLCQI